MSGSLKINLKEHIILTSHDVQSSDASIADTDLQNFRMCRLTGFIFLLFYSSRKTVYATNVIIFLQFLYQKFVS